MTKLVTEIKIFILLKLGNSQNKIGFLILDTNSFNLKNLPDILQSLTQSLSSNTNGYILKDFITSTCYPCRHLFTYVMAGLSLMLSPYMMKNFLRDQYT